ncbi:GNAT family N-acetyltransferase [Candidatus Gottesmanbacteria bacterium]|nr:GNAT family N-acetyltransferase [Candidatus Gottesmanbacteria bacterium]
MKPRQIIKTFTSKKGNNVVFRYAKSDDLEAMLSYINALIAEDTFIGLFGKPLTRDEEEKTLKEILEGMKKEDKVFIAVEINGAYKGNAGIDREKTRRKKHVGNIGISLAAEYRSEGIGAELMTSLIEEGKKLGMKLLYLTCLENNDHALYLYEKLGFKRCGYIPNACFWKGSYVGEVTLYLPIK